MKQPLVTVIISAYNHEKYIEDAILSVVNQTYKNIELLVFDDGSKDSTPMILDRLSEQYKFYFEKQENIGLPATRNKGIKMARGEFIAGIASDDMMLAERIEELVKHALACEEQVGFVCGDVALIDEQGNRIPWQVGGKSFDTFFGYYLDRRKDVNESNIGSYETLVKGNYIPAAGVLIRREDLIRVGLYDETVLVEDWDMLLKLSRHHVKMIFITNVVSLYRWHASNTVKVLRKKVQLDACKLLLREAKIQFMKLHVRILSLIIARLVFTVGTIVVPKWVRKLLGLHSLVD